MFKEAGTSTIIDVVLDGTAYPVIIRKYNAIRSRISYCIATFKRFAWTKCFAFSVPIHLEGRDEIRLQPSVLTQALNELDIECLPADIPESVSINVVDMTFETPLFVKDLDIFWR